MNCKNCGAELHEGSAFCGNCGMRVEIEQPVYEAPAEPVYEAPAQPEFTQEVHTEYQEQGTYTAPVQPEYTEAYQPEVPVGEKPNTVLWIVLTAIEIFTCCQITGIIGLIFAIIGHLSAEKGDYEDANKKVKIAKTLFWIGLALGLLFVVAYLVLVAIGVAAGITEEMLYY